MIRFLRSCQAASGGFGGGPLQLPHLAPTYAATAALVSLGGAEALDAVDRAAMLDFICRLAVPPEHGGGFRVCQGLTPHPVASTVSLSVCRPHPSLQASDMSVQTLAWTCCMWMTEDSVRCACSFPVVCEADCILQRQHAGHHGICMRQGPCCGLCLILNSMLWLCSEP